MTLPAAGLPIMLRRVSRGLNQEPEAIGAQMNVGATKTERQMIKVTSHLGHRTLMRHEGDGGKVLLSRLVTLVLQSPVY